MWIEYINGDNMNKCQHEFLQQGYRINLWKCKICGIIEGDGRKY